MKRLLIFIIFILFIPTIAAAAITFDGNGDWFSSYNCAEWSQGSAVSCDDLSAGGSWTDSCGNGEQITTAANYAGGAGGRGQRHWIGDGINSNSGGLRAYFSTPQTELWFRFYFRYQTGFNWSTLIYQKLIYVKSDTFASTNNAAIITLYSSDQVGVEHQGTDGGGYYASASGTGWNTMMGGATSDGSWHLYEAHIKMDTNGTDGVTEIWIDNVQVVNKADCDYEGTTDQGWVSAHIGENQRIVSNSGACMYLDYDDVAISTSGRIGAIGGGGDTSPPVISNGLPGGEQAYGTTSVNMQVTTDETANCKYGTVADTAYASIANTFTTTDATAHAQTISVSNGQSYTYYVRCQDTSGNPTTSDYTISFSVAAADSTPPVISADLPSSLPSGTTSTNMVVGTDETATCKYDTTPDTAYASMANTFSTTGGTSHIQTISGMSDGNTYTFYVRCSDGTNANTSDYTIQWTVQSAGTDPPGPSTYSNILFQEGFDDASLDARGWYDNTTMNIDTTIKYSGAGSLRFDWIQTGTQPTVGGAIRKLFTPSEELYVEYYVLYPAGYVGSGHVYHPHEIHIGSDREAPEGGLAYSYLMFYIEHNALKPRLDFQDAQNINTTYGTPTIDLTSTTEIRSIAGCNGALDSSYSFLDCYYSNGKWYNDKTYDATASISNGDWHKVRVYIKLNTTGSGTTNQDGIIRYWLDDVLVIDKTDVTMRTSARANLKLNQFVIAPYIGDGSPVAQSFYIDNLVVANVPAASAKSRFRLGTKKTKFNGKVWILEAP